MPFHAGAPLRHGLRTRQAAGFSGRWRLGLFTHGLKQAVAQRAVPTAHGVDVQQLEQHDERGQAAADDGFAIFADAGHVQRVDVARLNQALAQPVKLAQGDVAINADAPGFAQRRQHRAHSAGRAIGGIPARAGKAGGDVCQNFSRVRLGAGKNLLRELPSCKVALRAGDAADGVGLHVLRLRAAADDDFGRAPAYVHNDAALAVIGQQAGDATVDERRFFVPADHGNGQPQHLLGFLQENGRVARFAQGLRGHGAHMRRLHSAQVLRKLGQALPAALHGLWRQQPGFVDPAAQAHGFFQVLQPPEAGAFLLGDFKAKTVGAKVNGRPQGLACAARVQSVVGHVGKSGCVVFEKPAPAQNQASAMGGFRTCPAIWPSAVSGRPRLESSIVFSLLLL